MSISFFMLLTAFHYSLAYVIILYNVLAWSYMTNWVCFPKM